MYIFSHLPLQNRSINHSEGSHGVAGIFVKYDLSSLKIRVREVHKPYWMFLVRMCGIIGGIFSVSGENVVGDNTNTCALLNHYNHQVGQLVL